MNPKYSGGYLLRAKQKTSGRLQACRLEDETLADFVPVKKIAVRQNCPLPHHPNRYEILKGSHGQLANQISKGGEPQHIGKSVAS